MVLLSPEEEKVPVNETMLSCGGQLGGEHAATREEAADDCDRMSTSEW
jgi:hypothetical protein